MLQRIQTIYMLLAAVLMAATTFLTTITFSNADGLFHLQFLGVFNSNGDPVYNSIPLTVLLLAATGVSFVSIFLFKNRMLQVRLNGFALILMLGYYPLMFYYRSLIHKALEASSTFLYPTIFPIVAAILTYLSIRAIGKDEALIRSLDRIR